MLTGTVVRMAMDHHGVSLYRKHVHKLTNLTSLVLENI